MPPGKYNTTIYAGDDWQRTIAITDEGGAPLDLTGYTARWQLRAYPGAPTAALSLATDSGIAIDGVTLTISISGEVTAQLTAGSYYHDLELTTPEGAVTTYLAGIISVQQDVSR